MTGMGEHRVPLLGAAWRRNDDPALSRDPRVRAVVGALATLPQPEMRAEFRTDLRAQLVAITPRIVAESAETRRMTDISPAATQAAGSRPTPQGRAAAARTGPRHSDSALARLRGLHLGRPLAVTASVLVAFALLLGGAVMMSKKALPGDALYGLKRASERLELATAGSDLQKAKDHLDFATNRAEEAQSLATRLSGSALSGPQAAGTGSGATAKLIVSTLQSADSDVRTAAQLLGTNAVRRSSAQPLATMTGWAPSQAQRLTTLAQSLPDGASRAQALSSLALVQAAQTRASALAAKMGCSCLSTANSDSLGPKPCTTCGTTTTTPSNGTTPTTRPTGSHVRPRPGKVTVGGSSHDGGAVSTPAPAGATGSGSSPSATPTLPITLPTLTSGTPKLPISGNSCGVSVSLPLLGGAGVGLCSGVNVNLGN